MKLTLKTIVQSADALNRFSVEKMPIADAWRVAHNLNQLEADFKLAEDARIKLIREKYGIEDKTTNTFEVPPNRVEEFAQELRELLSVEVELDIHLLDPNSNIQISPADLKFLSWMFNSSKATK